MEMNSPSASLAPEALPLRSRIHWRNVSLLGGSLAALVALFVVLLRDPATVAVLRDRLDATFGEFWKLLREEFFLNPWFYAVIAGVLLLERLVPADPNQAAEQGRAPGSGLGPVQAADPCELPPGRHRSAAAGL